MSNSLRLRGLGHVTHCLVWSGGAIALTMSMMNLLGLVTEAKVAVEKV